MKLPDYYGGSILNLMASIENALGGRSIYPELKMLPSSELMGKTIVLMIIDGLGFDYLKKHRCILHKGLRGNITSVFPSTTTAAITTFMTGMAPQQHALPGWFTYLKEVRDVAVVLPFTSRATGEPLKKAGITLESIIDALPVSKRIQFPSIYISKKELARSAYTRAMKFSKRIGVSNFREFISRVGREIISKRPKLIVAYWPEFDSACHTHGVGSRQALLVFKKIVSGVKQLEKHISSNSVLIVTADHGLIDSKKTIILNEHPEILECLSQPLCGETRVAYCYVRKSKAREFEHRIKKKLGRYCEIYKSSEILRRHFFGPFAPSRRLRGRIGNYVLIMKDSYTIRDFLSEDEKNTVLIGNHGGVSRTEMYVPLIVFK